MPKTIFSWASGIEDCINCRLCESRTQVVKKKGDSKLVIIGEAPGEHEDKTGIPFSGAAGEVLSYCLKIAKIEDYALTNVVRCRPPENRKPKPDEIEACRDWLMKDIENATHLILLGDTALKAFFQHAKLQDVIGIRMKWNDKIVVANYHPASALHSPNFTFPMLHVWKRMHKQLYEKETPAEFDRVDYLPREGELVAIDTEIINGELICIALAWKERDGIKATVLKEPRSLPEYRFVAHNWKYDLKYLAMYGCIEWDTDADDTAVLAYLNHLPHISLKKLYAFIYHCRYPEFEELFSRGIDDRIYEYCMRDAVMTLKVYQELEKYPYYNKIDRPVPRVLCNMEFSGVRLDVDRLNKLHDELRQESEELRKDIEEHLGINPNSPKQLSDKLGISSTNKMFLELLEDDSAKKVLEYREIYKLFSTYAQSWKKSLDGDRIYPEFHQIRTITGRLSSENPNFQNIPSRSQLGKKFRELVIASPGNKLVVADFDQQELRLLAHFSRDPKLLKAYSEGEDVHAKTARMVFGEQISKEQRNIGKMLNFAVIYGAGKEKVASVLKIPVKEAEDLLRKYFDYYKGVKEWIEWVKKIAMRGYVETAFGRKIPLSRSLTFSNGKFIVNPREAPNYIIQGTGADLTKSLMSVVSDIILQVHDEIVADTRDPDKVVEQIKSWTPPIPFNVQFPITVHVVDRWSEAK